MATLAAAATAAAASMTTATTRVAAATTPTTTIVPLVAPGAPRAPTRTIRIVRSHSTVLRNNNVQRQLLFATDEDTQTPFPDARLIRYSNLTMTALVFCSICQKWKPFEEEDSCHCSIDVQDPRYGA